MDAQGATTLALPSIGVAFDHFRANCVRRRNKVDCRRILDRCTLAIGSLRCTLIGEEKGVSENVAKEMGTGLLAGLKSGTTSERAESRNGLLTVPNGETGPVSIIGHPGLEDRLHAMMLSLRSLQSKIRVCAEDIRVKAPPGLHGVGKNEEGKGLGSIENSPRATASEIVPNGVDDAAAGIVRVEKTLESMRDDLLGLSVEWEATVKLVHKEKRRSPSPLPSTAGVDSDAVPASAVRDMESPSEAEEDAAASSDDAGAAGQGGWVQAGSGFNDVDGADDDEDDSDLAELLLRSTSPNSLPPPGLEQVFESIAGIAGLSGLGVDGIKASRAERIEQAKRQRQLDAEKLASDKAAHRHTMDPTGMMSELSDVIQSRKSVREQRHYSALPPTAGADRLTVHQHWRHRLQKLPPPNRRRWRWVHLST